MLACRSRSAYQNIIDLKVVQDEGPIVMATVEESNTSKQYWILSGSSIINKSHGEHISL